MSFRQRSGLRTTLLRLTVILSCWLKVHHCAIAANVTVQDTDPAILYQPPESWHPSSSTCSICLNPGVQTSYHEAIHFAITNDGDDLPLPANSSHKPPPPTSTPKTTPSLSPSIPISTDKDDDLDKSNSKAKKRALARWFDQRLNLGSQDPDVTISFNFTGSAIYIFGMQPLGAQAVNGPPTTMNLTFSLDNRPSGKFNSVGTAGGTGFQSNRAVLSLSGLEEGPHQLLVTVGQNSTFIFDHLVYTSTAEASGSGSGVSTTGTALPLAQSSPSTTINPTAKKHNIATFAGAVGGSVGVLAIFSLCLAISIIRRRRSAARRDRLDSEGSLHTNGSDDSPHMSGPAPFVPRYFPDTVIPPDPPTYMAALASNHNSSTLLASITGNAYSSAHRSYADIPPASPPPLDDGVHIPPPPSFPEAISATPPISPTNNLPPPQRNILPHSIPVGEENSHNPNSVGVNSSNSAAAPELVPLLQSVEDDTRPQSRASRRSADLHETPHTTVDGS